MSAEDEVDMPNDGPGSEEQISVPSCYSNKFASVSGPGETRGLQLEGPQRRARPCKPGLLHLSAESEVAAPAPADHGHVPVHPNLPRPSCHKAAHPLAQPGRPGCGWSLWSPHHV
ncbi:Hypothetical predicted protein [Marmota monax]|uniref:Uncharacterized protein n=1 Tax=Marmota monax TaxID=9995 RepID=A0A5E4D1A1_MARMO|nr:hypothetical protein GHT09_001239 [Marmota monax]VTJ87836.1 Hypothetical predicted protein [Marmota monax]